MASSLDELTAEALTPHVIKVSTENVKNERLVELVTGLIQHLHDYVKEVQLKPTEWEAAVQYLTQVRKSLCGTALCSVLIYRLNPGWPRLIT